MSRDRVVQLCPSARPYIKKSFEGILMYEIAGDFINKYCNYADPKMSASIEAFHGKRDTLERDIFTGGLFSFSPIVIFVI